ncbi:MAG: CPBP family intramembrane metalloprotease [Planctomycetes bacterium]|nr:CPBP family intramembrane metalloprotease [Planctomycetota bacterium]
MTPIGMKNAPDFPFYSGTPVGLSGHQWLVLLGGVILGFLLLVSPWTKPAQPWGHWVPALLFCIVPLAALALVAGRHWTALFRRPRIRDLALMVGIAALNLAVTLSIGALFAGAGEGSSNPMFQSLGEANAGTRASVLASMVPQLLGEELLTILPFLALLWLLVARLKTSRRTAIVLAWALSAIPFALAHLPTYEWNLLQCLAIIGTARLVLSLGYLLSRNLWVSTGAHVINDWALFGVALWLGSLAS